jgi:hypothetical protein
MQSLLVPRIRLTSILAAAVLLLNVAAVVPQQDPVAAVAARFDLSDVMIPARDGVETPRAASSAT